MEYTEGMNAFVAILEDMAASPVVMSAKKIKSLLKCIAYYDEFRAAVDIAKDDFDYEETMSRCYVEVGKSASFRMPMGTKDKVAIVICLLLDFDQGKRDFYDFIIKCFPDDSAVDSYIQFCIKILRPFKEAMLSLIENGDSDEFAPSAIKQEVEFANDGIQNQTEYLIITILEKIKVASITDSERADMLVMMEGFAAAIDNRDSLMIRAIWLGLKKNLISHKICQAEIAKLEDALRLYLVIK
ncbi:MAG TPA: hypothetical protein VJZ69_04570 [Clostridia bacterium]|nr:hypothetical protein [Clostridia bacterium]